MVHNTSAHLRSTRRFFRRQVLRSEPHSITHGYEVKVAAVRRVDSGASVAEVAHAIEVKRAVDDWTLAAGIRAWRSGGSLPTTSADGHTE